MTTAVTIRDRITDARRRLKAAGISDTESEFDARLLAQETLGWDTARVIADAGATAPHGFDEAFDRLVTRRERREPLAYILGRREFWGLTFEVNPSVLIPRPETELLIEVAGELVSSQTEVRFADVGTGSGCLAVALAAIFPSARVIATDISPGALEIARRNADRHGVSSRIDFVKTPFLDGVTGTFDLIVSNPPYVRETDRASLPPEVRDHEPPSALFAGHDGLAVIHGLLNLAARQLADNGTLVFEFGFGQAQDVSALIGHTDGIEMTGMRNDLQGIPRAAIVSRPGQTGQFSGR